MNRQLLVFIAMVVFFIQCRKTETKKVETFPLAETTWHISYYRTHSDTSFLDAPFPYWEIEFKGDSTFSLNLSGDISHGRYSWTKSNAFNNQFPSGNLHLVLSSWNPPCCTGVMLDKFKTLLETANEWSTHGVDTVKSIDVRGNNGFFHAQKL